MNDMLTCICGCNRFERVSESSWACLECDAQWNGPRRPQRHMIAVNGIAHMVPYQLLNYDAILRLAGNSAPTTSVWTITVHYPYTSRSKDCTLTPGQSILPEPGTSITVADTSRA